MGNPEITQHVIKSLPRQERSVYDFDIASSISDIQRILQQINDNGYDIIGIGQCGIMPYNGDVIILFRRPAHG